MSENTNWILTYSGRKFFPLEPNIDDIIIIDIAHALSNICRFTGHCREFYSVAQHSLLVAEMIWKETEDAQKTLSGLLHDASEAYLCDIARPVKHSKEFAVYRQIEAKLQSLIDIKYGTASDLLEVKKADERLLNVEAYYLMPKHPEWTLNIEKPVDYPFLKGITPIEAKRQFLYNFRVFESIITEKKR